MQVLQERSFKGIIYALKSKSGLIYIGSTTKLPEIRLRQHRYAFERHVRHETQRHMSSTQLFKEGRENVTVQVLEQGYFKSKKDLQRLEGEHIKRHLGKGYCVNKYHTGSSSKEDRKAYNKEYAARQQMIKRKCQKCNTFYGLGTWRQHTRRNKCVQNEGQPVDQNPRRRRILIRNQRSLYSCPTQGCPKEYPTTKALINHENRKHRRQE